MLFNSYEFIFLFLPITLLGFFILGRHGLYEIAIAWLVLASLFFYGWWNPPYLLLLGFSILFNYRMGIALVKAQGIGQGRWASALLVAGIAINLAIIGYFKYANFFIDTVNDLTGTAFHLGAIILPIGISFFTFQQITYLVDARRGETEEHSFLNYCLFVVFFPQLIAGPIVHHKEMLPQFAQLKTFRPAVQNIVIGGTIFCIGLFKKVVIADSFGLVATPIFAAADAGEPLHFFRAWEGTLAYTFQLYFDFSGYSDMAIGLGRLFGIKLPLNFNSPYQATSITEFWRRWHMTLSRFLRDYVYIPLGGNRYGTNRRYINLMITMLVGGLWHGAAWTFVFWGGLHGVFLVVNYAWRRLWRRPIDRWWSRLIARVITFFSVALAWVWFRAETFDGAIMIFKGMFNLPYTLQGRFGSLEPMLVSIGFRFDGPSISTHDYESILWLGFWLAFLWLIPNTQQWLGRFKPALNYDLASHPSGDNPRLLRLWPRLQWQPTPLIATVVGVMFAASVLGLSRVMEFLYFQF